MHGYSGNCAEKDEQNAFIRFQKSAEMENSNEIGIEINEQNAFIYDQKSVEVDNSGERFVKPLT